MRQVHVVWGALMAASLWACSGAPLVCEEPMPENVEQEPKHSLVENAVTDSMVIATVEWQQCPDMRVVRCTREYRPVCATRDTGVRCVTTPCPSTENFTASNACTACAQPDVTGYVLNACNAMQKTDSE